MCNAGVNGYILCPAFSIDIMELGYGTTLNFAVAILWKDKAIRGIWKRSMHESIAHLQTHM